MRPRGATLVELLIAVVIVTVAAGAVARAFITGLDYQRQFVRSVETRADQVLIEDSIVRLLQGAQISGGNGFFISPVPGNGGGGQSAASNGLGTGASSLVFTTTSKGLPPRYVEEKKEWQDLHERFGPQGGPVEVSLSTMPVGDAGRVEGLFVREQTPPDDDPAMGGKERLLDPRVRDVRFEFFDGQNWKDTWDSKGETDKDKIPSVVRVSYVLAEDRKPHTITVRLPLCPPQSGGDE